MLEKLYNRSLLNWESNFSDVFDLLDFEGQLFNNASNFVSKDGYYELSMDVDENSTEDNVEINLEKDGLVEVKYHVKKKNSERIVNVKEYLPKNADSDTLEAEIKNGKLIVTVKKRK